MNTILKILFRQTDPTPHLAPASQAHRRQRRNDAPDRMNNQEGVLVFTVKFKIAV